MLKIELRPGCTRTKGYISRKKRRTKKVTCKLKQGLNFTVNGNFCFCNDDCSKQNPEGKKRDFCRFSTTFKTVINLLLSKFRRWYFAKSAICIYSRYPYLKGILSNAYSWQLRQCSRDWESCNVAVWSCTASFGRQGRQWLTLLNFILMTCFS